MLKTARILLLVSFAGLVVSGAMATARAQGQRLRVPSQNARPGTRDTRLGLTSSVWCADDDGGPTGSPCANPTAFTVIQDAVNNASSGDEVRVAAGTYITSTGATVVNLNKAVTLTGGYPGGVSGWTSPGDENQTVIDGQGVRSGILASTNGITIVAQNLSVVNGAIVLNTGATLNNSMPVRTRDLTQSSGTIGGSAPITVTGNFAWSGGSQVDLGRTDVLTGAQLSIATSSAVGIHDGRVVNNFGTGTWSGTGFISLGGGGAGPGTLNNQTGAVFTIQNNSDMVSGTFNNLGTVTKTSPGDTTLTSGPGAVFNNSGLVQINSGRLLLGQGSSTGTFNAAQGATLAICNCGTQLFQPSSVIAGAGTFESAGPAETYISGTFSLPNLALLSGYVHFDSLGANTASTVMTLTQTSGALLGSRTISVTNVLDRPSGLGYMDGPGHTDILSGAQVNVNAGIFAQNGRVINNYGTANFITAGFGGANLQLTGATFNNRPGGVVNILNDGSIQDNGSNFGIFNNQGTFIRSNSGGAATLNFLAGGSSFTNSGLIEVQTGSLDERGFIFQTAGTTRMAGGNLQFSSASGGTFPLQGGTLEGAGTVTGHVDNTGGTLSPGLGPGLMTITGNYTQGAGGTLNAEFGGLTPVSQYDRLAVGGTATLNGSLNTSAINGFTPQNGDAFTILTYGAHSGVFSAIQGGTYAANYNPNDLTLVVGGPVATATATGTGTAQATSTPTVTSTRTSTNSPTPTRTNTQTATSTPVPTNTPTNTNTQTPSATRTSGPTNTPTATATRTNTASMTSTMTPTATTSPTPVAGCWSIYASPNSPQQFNELSEIGVVSANDVWAVGSESGASGNQALLEHWNGMAWSLVNVTIPNATNVGLDALTVVSASDIWAAGSYQPAGGVYQTLILHWNGSVWSQVASPSPGTQVNILYDMDAWAADDIWAVGYSEDVTSVYSPLILHYDGTGWQPVTNLPSLASIVYLMGVEAIAANNVWVVGYTLDTRSNTLTLHYDGSNWVIVTPPAGGDVGALDAVAAVSASDIWAVGVDTSVPRTRALTLHSTGGQWSVVSNPGSDPTLSYDLTDLSVLSDGEAWAVGEKRDSTLNQRYTMTMHWGGGGWSFVSSPNVPGQTNNLLEGVAAVSPGDTWAVGYSNAGFGSDRTLIERFSNPCNPPTFTPTPPPTSTPVSGCWSAYSSPNWPNANNYVRDVDALAANDVWGVGISDDNSTLVLNGLMEHWNGSAWSLQGLAIAPGADVVLNEVAMVSANNVWAVGAYEPTAGGHLQTLTEHYDGVAWNQVPSPNIGSDSNVLDAVDARASNDIWAIGRYYDPGTGRNLPIVLHYDGSSWQIDASLPAIPGFYSFGGVAAIAANNVWVVGATTDGVQFAPLILHYTGGGTWASLPAPVGSEHGSLRDVKGGSANDVWAVGVDFSTPPNRAITIHWNGSAWSTVTNPGSDPVLGYQLSDVTALPSGEAWAVGNIISGNASNTLTMHWGGGGWAIVSSPNPGSDNYLSGVSAVSPSDVWAAGYNSVGSSNVTLNERFTAPCLPPTPTSTATTTRTRTPTRTATLNPSFSPTSTGTRTRTPAATATRTPTVTTTATATRTYTATATGTLTATVTQTRTSTRTPTSTPTRTSTITPTAVPTCGTAWRLVSSPNVLNRDDNSLDDVVSLSANDAWAVGASSNGTTSLSPRTLIEHWDGNAWSIVPSPNGNNSAGRANVLYAVAGASASDVWAVGTYDTGTNGYHALLLHWDGSAWSLSPEPNVRLAPGPGIADVTALSTNDVWAVGTQLVGSSAQSLALHWDGSTWSVVTTPGLSQRNGLAAVEALTPSDIWAVGNISTTGALLLHWDGSAWSRFNNPTAIPGVLNDMSALSPGDIWAVGYRTDGSGLSLTVHYDGVAWSVVDTAQIQNAGQLYQVEAISPSNIWALTNSLSNTYRLLHWDGVAWTYVPDVAPPQTISNIPAGLGKVSGNDIWLVGGYYDGVQHNTSTLVERYSNNCPPPTSTSTSTRTATATSTVPTPTRTSTRTATPTACALDWRVVDGGSIPIPGAFHNSINDIDVFRPDDAWAVGETDPTGLGLALSEHWDGHSWQVVGVEDSFGVQDGLNAVTRRSVDEWWAGGLNGVIYRGTVDRFGYGWHRLGYFSGFNEDGIVDMAAGGGHIWAIGTSQQNRPYILVSVDGIGFDPSPVDLPAGTYHLKSVTAVSDSDAWAVGDINGDTPLILHWDGTIWSQSQIAGAPHNAVLNAISATLLPSADIWAVGSRLETAHPGSYVLHYNGSEWQEVSLPPQLNSGLSRVQVMNSHEVWASFRLTSQFAHWDGSSWTFNAGPPIPTGALDIVQGLGTSYAGELWAVGSHYTGTFDQGFFARYSTDCPIPTATGTPTRTPLPTNTATPTPTATNYVVVQTTGTVVPGTTDIGNHCDNCATTISLPFPYALYNVRFSRVTLGSNGTMGFVGNANPASNRCVPSAAFSYGILPYWDDLTTNCAGCGIFTSISGGAPSRVFNIEWRATGVGGTLPLDFEVRLYEGQSRFDLIYARTDPASTESIGVQRDTGSLFTSVTCAQLDPGKPAHGDGNDNWIIDDGTLLEFSGIDGGPTPTATACLIQFSDVPVNSAFYPYIRCLACRGIITGYDDGTFRPGNSVTRGQLAKMASNAVGLNDEPGEQIFEDVQPGSTFYSFIQRLAVRGYMSGYPCGGPGEPCGPGNKPYFRPAGTATRGQVSKIVSNTASFDDAPAGQTFEDVPTSHPFYLWVERLSARGIISGYQCGGIGEPCDPQQRPYFRAANNVTRGQTAKIIANTFTPGCVSP